MYCPATFPPTKTPLYHSGERGFILKIEGVLEATILLESGPFGRPKTSLFLSSLPFLSSWSEGFRFSLLLLTYEYARGVWVLFITGLARPALSHISNVLHRGVGLSQFSSPRTFEQGRSRRGFMHAPLLVFHGTFEFSQARSDRVGLGAS